MKWRRVIAPIKPVCLEGPLCLASTAHGSSSPQQLLLSSLLLLSPTFSCSPLNLMVPSSSPFCPCDSWRASVLYYSIPPRGVLSLVIYVSLAHTGHARMYTQSHRDKNVRAHTRTLQSCIASHTCHIHSHW